jgi:ATP-dependent Clp protease protease subunit
VNNQKIDSRIKVKKIEDLIDLPITVVVNKFDEIASKDFRKQFQDALNTGQDVVPVIIDSYGGQAYSLLSMINIIKSSPVPVATIVSGKAMSCGAILFTCGAEGYRYIDPFATLLIHDVSSCSCGKVEEIKADAGEAERLNKMVYHLMAENVGKPPNYFIDLVHEKGHADWYLDANECIKHNLANHIRTPRFNINIDVNISFGK